jgi:hypothetical protein
VAGGGRDDDGDQHCAFALDPADSLLVVGRVLHRRDLGEGRRHVEGDAVGRDRLAVAGLGRVAAVELDGRRAQAWNLYSSVKVGERDGGPYGIDRRQTLIIGRDLPGAMTESLTLTTVLLPRVTGGPVSSLTEASPAAALRALAPSTRLQAPHDDHPDMGLMVALARRLPASHLNLGADQGIPAIREALAL